MRRKSHWLLPALMLVTAPAVLAQEQGSSPAPAASISAADDAEAELDALNEEYSQARQEFMSRYQAASKEEQAA